MTVCKNCNAEIIWLKLADLNSPELSKPGAKSNPINAKPDPNGGLVISRERGLYRFASKAEISEAKHDGRNLYTSHFETCPASESFRSKKKTNETAEASLFDL